MTHAAFIFRDHILPGRKLVCSTLPPIEGVESAVNSRPAEPQNIQLPCALYTHAKQIYNGAGSLLVAKGDVVGLDKLSLAPGLKETSRKAGSGTAGSGDGAGMLAEAVGEIACS